MDTTAPRRSTFVAPADGTDPGPFVTLPAPSRRRRRTGGSRVLTAAAVVLLASGVTVTGVTLTAPGQIDVAYGAVQMAVATVRVNTLGEVPRLRLGTTGDQDDLETCDGTFTEMTSYRETGLPPVWAAHNTCGGDTILPLTIGDAIDLETGGATTRYQVVDMREVPKRGATTEDITGITGELVVQSCFYGPVDTSTMLFLGLTPHQDTPQDPLTTAADR